MIVPIRKPFTLPELAKEFDFTHSQTGEYGEPRYAMIYPIPSYAFELKKKDKNGHQWSTYIHMNQDATFVIGIETSVSNDTTDSWMEQPYLSPFAPLYAKLGSTYYEPHFDEQHQIEHYPGLFQYDQFKLRGEVYKPISTHVTKEYFNHENPHSLTVSESGGLFRVQERTPYAKQTAVDDDLPI